MSLLELSAREVATSIPFELVENYQGPEGPVPVPEILVNRIAFWSFPDLEEDIRLYSCLANGSAEEFDKGKCKNSSIHLKLRVFVRLGNYPLDMVTFELSKANLFLFNNLIL